MRQIFLSAVFLLAAGSAMAASIEVIGPSRPKEAGSIITETCGHCPPLRAEASKKEYSVPELRPGAFQQAEVRDVDGEKKIYRTENWMGGSPVLFVSKATPEQMLALAPPVPAEGIDNEATAAVVGGNAKPIAAGMEQTAPLDASAFELRF
ncbi:plant virulence effector HPE1-like domain-containing protein [Rhizobium sp. ZK1]|uniref:plant virulence effector HPE1-like domain-containing protein n=1 Tax=Rhizobium sp. ZK1 TaxID=3389872 RepID=UPI0039F67FF3